MLEVLYESYDSQLLLVFLYYTKKLLLTARFGDVVSHHHIFSHIYFIGNNNEFELKWPMAK